MKQQIILYTGSYPYGQTTESFIGPELEVVNNLEQYEVRIVPVVKDSPLREVPVNITLDNSICDASLFYKMVSFLMIFTPSSLKLIIKDRKKITRFRYLVHLLKYQYAANLVYKDVKRRANTDLPIVFYSYWMSYAPIAFGLYKKKHTKTPHHFVSRGHGGDVYTVDRGRFYPFREFILEQIDHVYIVSSFGRDYLKGKYPTYSNKIDRAYLGVMPLTAIKGNNEKYRVVSCSSVYDFKRVDLLFRSLEQFALTHPDIKMEWTHYGGGYLFDNLKTEIENNHKAGNLSIELKGRCNNEIVLDDYCHKGYHVFIHLSTTEGLPVSMMEALSASIPIIATAVGGVPEIVTEQSGCLLDVNFKQEDFDRALLQVLYKHESLSVSAKKFFDSYFNAQNNYREFYKEITRI